MKSELDAQDNQIYKGRKLLKLEDLLEKARQSVNQEYQKIHTIIYNEKDHALYPYVNINMWLFSIYDSIYNSGINQDRQQGDYIFDVNKDKYSYSSQDYNYEKKRQKIDDNQIPEKKYFFNNKRKITQEEYIKLAKQRGWAEKFEGSIPESQSDKNLIYSNQKEQEAMQEEPSVYKIDRKIKILLPFLDLQIVDADGLCFYRSIAKFIYGDQHRCGDVKNEIINYLTADENISWKLIYYTTKSILEPSIQRQKEETEAITKELCLDEYKKPQAYADELIVTSASKAIGKNIFILQKNSVNLYFAVDKENYKNSETCWIYYHPDEASYNDNKAHYNALRVADEKAIKSLNTLVVNLSNHNNIFDNNLLPLLQKEGYINYEYLNNFEDNVNLGGERGFDATKSMNYWIQ